MKKLGDICKIIGGGTPSKSNKKFYIGDIPWATVRDMKNDLLYKTEFKISEEAVSCSSTNVIVAGNIIIATRVGLGKVCILQQDTAINQDLKAIVPRNDQLDRKFLFWWLKNVAEFLEASGIGATVKGVKIDFINNLIIPAPSLKEQKHIVAILDQAFADIEKIRANTEKNLKNVRELFESYLQEVFSQRGGRRNKWAEYTLGEVCNFFNGQAHEQHVSENGQYVLINSKFISSNGQSKKRTDKALAPLFSGDVVFVMSDVPKGKALAKCFLVDTDNTYTLNQRICVIRSDKYHKKFLYYHLNRHKYLLGFDNGENQTNLRKNDILNCPLYLPPISEQQHIVDKLDLLNAQIKELEKFYTKKRNSLIELKKSLLHQAFSGQLTKQEVAT